MFADVRIYYHSSIIYQALSHATATYFREYLQCETKTQCEIIASCLRICPCNKSQKNKLVVQAIA